MSNLIVKGTELTPTIEFDSSTGNLLIKGTSIPENPFESFDPLLKVLDSYNAQPSSKTKVDFLLEYFNTSSSKYILEVLKKIQVLHLNGNEVEINWHYEEEDEDILEIGQDFSSMIKIPFNLKVIHSN
jgi:hypothetical protein